MGEGAKQSKRPTAKERLHTLATEAERCLLDAHKSRLSNGVIDSTLLQHENENYCQAVDEQQDGKGNAVNLPCQISIVGWRESSGRGLPLQPPRRQRRLALALCSAGISAPGRAAAAAPGAGHGPGPPPPRCACSALLAAIGADARLVRALSSKRRIIHASLLLQTHRSRPLRGQALLGAACRAAAPPPCFVRSAFSVVLPPRVLPQRALVLQLVPLVDVVDLWEGSGWKLRKSLKRILNWGAASTVDVVDLFKGSDTQWLSAGDKQLSGGEPAGRRGACGGRRARTDDWRGRTATGAGPSQPEPPLAAAATHWHSSRHTSQPGRSTHTHEGAPRSTLRR